MTEYQIQPNTRRCAVTGRELQPGEKVYTALLEDGGKFLRHDYSGEAWQGPPPGAFSFWCGRLPAQDEIRKPRIDDELLMDCFQRLEGQADPNRVSFRYVVALLLMRRKRLKFEEARKDAVADHPRHAPTERLCLRCARTGVKYEVVNPRLTAEQMVSVQEEVFKVLGWE